MVEKSIIPVDVILILIVFGTFLTYCDGGASDLVKEEDYTGTGLSPVNGKELRLTRVDNITFDKIPSYIRRMGKQDVNYYIGMDQEHGNLHPYINCHKYNRRECNKATPAECTEVVKCYLKDPVNDRRHLACMAAYVYNFTEMRLNNNSDDDIDRQQSFLQPDVKGCWLHNEGELRECRSEDECVADTRRTGTVGREAKFCCCKTHECNAKLIVRKELLPPLSNESTMDFEGDEWQVADTLSVIFIIFLLLCVCLAFLLFVQTLRSKFSKKRENQMKPILTGSDQITEAEAALLNSSEGDDQHREIMFKDGQKVECKDVVLLEEISNGRFGQVHKAKVGEHLIAVKVFPPNDMDSWINEMDLYSLRAIRRNENIAEFLGGFRSEKQYWLLIRFYENCSLFDYLKKHTNDLAGAIRMIASMLNGLAFLHEEITHGMEPKPTIVHRDLKSKNILVRDDLSTCITDFGLALKCDTRGVTAEQGHGQVGTRRYMSPEVLEGATEFSSFAFQQIDVYAAALVVWEVLSRTILPNTENDQISEFLLPYEREIGQNPSIGQIRELVVTQRYRPRSREALLQNQAFSKANTILQDMSQVSSQIVRTMQEMWDHEPDGRITSSCARDRLVRIQESL